MTNQTDGHSASLVQWVTDATVGTPEYLQDLRPELVQYIEQADRHTLKLIQKFIRSLRR